MNDFKTTDQLDDVLKRYTGTEYYYESPIPKIVCTDGFKAMAEYTEGYWIINHIGPLITMKFPNPTFQVWKLTVTDDQKGRLTMQEDLGKPYLYDEKIPYTDFPVGSFEFFVCKSANYYVMLLKSEY